MTEWYYAKDGQQNGPVSFEALVEIARQGGLNPTKDLVWNKSMTDWVIAGQVPGLCSPAAAPNTPTADPSNPYAAPTAGWNEVAQITVGENLEEISPGSDPLDVMACAKRGFNLTIRHFGMILVIGIVYLGVSFGAGIILSAVDSALGLTPPPVTVPTVGESPTEQQIQAFANGFQNQGSSLHQILNQLLSLFLSIGLTRIGLNLVSGKPISVGMLFSGARKLLPMLGGYIIFMAAFVIGFILLIVGYDQARLTPIVLWEPPIWTRHLALLLNLLAFILLAAAYVPRNSIKAKIGHPMIAGVKIWAFAHLIANGTLADVLLFGGFLLWAVVDFRASRRRDRMNATVYPSGAMVNTLVTLVVGLGAGVVFMLWLHARWVGVSPLGM
jgi:uncharacterized membrane protein